MLLTDRVYDFEIRVGDDGSDLGNNKICYKQFEPMATGTQRFQCLTYCLGTGLVSIKQAVLEKEILCLERSASFSVSTVGHTQTHRYT